MVLWGYIVGDPILGSTQFGHLQDMLYIAGLRGHRARMRHAACCLQLISRASRLGSSCGKKADCQELAR